ncbi:GAF domain-containing protein [Motilibacter peucedani]|uniref:GAF domain-containing protein n=1 Tax=Motilibacter peucedani TaxID=598650 RepID=UPI0011C34D1C|nr:GAF domain-containing protein [Motilibacter peucedani]
MSSSRTQAVRSRLRATLGEVGLTTTSTSAAVAAFLLGAVAGKSTGSHRRWLLLAGAVCVAAGVLAGWLQRRRDSARVQTAREVAEEAQEEFGLTLNGALAPLTSYLGEMAVALTTAERRAVGGRLAQAAVDAAVRVTTPSARSAFYRLDARGHALVREAYAGRPTPPRTSFVSGTSDGNFVLDLVRSGDILVVEDVAQHPFVTPSPRGGYATVIAAAVNAGSERIGLLTVDAPAVGELGGTDVEVVRVLANLLGAGLAESER